MFSNMFPAPSSSGLLHPWLQMVRPVQPGLVSLWEPERVRDHLRGLQDSLGLLKAVQKELEAIHAVKKSNVQDNASDGHFNLREGGVRGLLEIIGEKGTDIHSQESLSLEAANALMLMLRNHLSPFSIISSQSSWEEKALATRLAQKLQKSKRNKQWRKKRRKRIAESICKEKEMFDKADQEADEWRAKEIAKDIAKRKVENMKAISTIKAKEEKRRLEAELELVFVVEKLQELRAIRVEKLKKQGQFFPEEDDKFLERVQAAVEEEERQAAAAAETTAAKDAIATAEESRKVADSRGSNLTDFDDDSRGEMSASRDQKSEMNNVEPLRSTPLDSERGETNRQDHYGGYDSVASFPFKFYHYYHGSNHDLGTLIEVRRTWDAYIRPGGSRIPGHWVQPPPPSNAVWASYLVGPKP